MPVLIFFFMQLSELETLQKPEVRQLIKDNLSMDSREFALKFRGDTLPVAAMATQLKLQQKAAQKLPAWQEAGCLFTQRAYEQSSGQRAVALKDFFQGKKAVDLCGGLGVDSWAMARHFGSVVYLDADPLLCRLARLNFASLGRQNIKVRHEKAEAFLAREQGQKFDLIYLDPDRRDQEGKRRHGLEDCSPDVLSLLPQMLSLLSPVGCILLKASPLLDIAEGKRILEERGVSVSVHVIAIDNECKELLFSISPPELEKADLVHHHLDRKGETGSFCFPWGAEVDLGREEIGKGMYVYEADVAFYKSRMVLPFFKNSVLQGSMSFADGYFYSHELNLDLPARIFMLEKVLPFKPKKLRGILKKEGVERINISRRHFDLSVRKIIEKTGIVLGGEDYLLFTQNLKNERLALIAKRIK